jgi:hypothetical protein
MIDAPGLLPLRVSIERGFDHIDRRAGTADCRHAKRDFGEGRRPLYSPDA